MLLSKWLLGRHLNTKTVRAFDICRKLVSAGSGPAGEGSDLIRFHLKAENDKEACEWIVWLD